MEIWGLLGCLYLLTGRSNADEENIPIMYKTRQIHQNHLDIVLFIGSILTFAFKLVALLACDVIFES
jgi:hypothetical protein